MKQRGVKFIAIPDEYYTDLEARLATSPVKLLENFEKVREFLVEKILFFVKISQQDSINC